MIFGNDVMIPKEIFKFEGLDGPSKRKNIITELYVSNFSIVR